MSTFFLKRFVFFFLDYFFRNRPAIQASPDIAYIEIAEDSIQGIGRWPWPRQYHAVLTHYLTEWKARAIVFDVLFSEPSTEFDDGAFGEALLESSHVYLPVVLEEKPRQTGKKWIHSLPEFESAVAGSGHINMVPDRDGTLRRISTVLKYRSEVYPHLAVRVASDYLGVPWESILPPD